MVAKHFQLARERDEWVIDRATRHVCVTRHFESRFTCRQAAYRRLAKLRKRKHLKVIGTLMSDGGRPLDVYANRLKPKAQDFRHEVLLTDFLLCYDTDSAIVRDPKKTNKRLRPDAELFRQRRLFYVELDTGSESLETQVVERQQLYEHAANLLPQTDAKGNPCYRSISRLDDVFVLYVTSSQQRLRNLVGVSRPLKNLVLFATLEQALKQPDGRIWETVDGRRVRLP